MEVMNPYLPEENLHSDLLDRMLVAEVKGGQNSDGSQKDGFLKYEKGRPVAIYDLDKGEYIAIDSFKRTVKEKLGDMPAAWKPWKEINFSPEKENLLSNYFAELKTLDTMGTKLAKAYLKRSNEIGELLVNSNVANKKEDVNTVMLTGFYHAYGPINSYL
jgi:hypothetical protein